MEETITTRLLPPDEWQRLIDAFPEDKRDRVPSSEIAAAVVAEQDGRIIGFLILQFALHLEPIWVDKAFRGEGVPDAMWRLIENRLSASAVFSSSSGGITNRLLEDHGFRPSPWRLYEKEAI